MWTQHSAFGRAFRRGVLRGGQLPPIVFMGMLRFDRPSTIHVCSSSCTEGPRGSESQEVPPQSSRDEVVSVKKPEQSGVPLHEVIDVESNFNLRPYSSTSAGILLNLMYPARSGLAQLKQSFLRFFGTEELAGCAAADDTTFAIRGGGRFGVMQSASLSEAFERWSKLRKFAPTCER